MPIGRLNPGEGSDLMGPEYMLINGRKRLTLEGFNTLRRENGLQPILPVQNESVAGFKQRAREAREEFIQQFGHLYLDCEIET